MVIKMQSNLIDDVVYHSSDFYKKPQVNFPIHLLSLMSFLSLFGLILIAWSMNRQGNQLVKAQQQHGQMLSLKSEICLLYTSPSPRD